MPSRVSPLFVCEALAPKCYEDATLERLSFSNVPIVMVFFEHMELGLIEGPDWVIYPHKSVAPRSSEPVLVASLLAK